MSGGTILLYLWGGWMLTVWGLWFVIRVLDQ